VVRNAGLSRRLVHPRLRHPYSFCWAMGGENQVFADMQGVNMGALR
jgi:hypothetical protein